MRVEVYWNFNRKCYSVRALEGPSKGRVIGHRERVNIHNAKFVVRKAGRDRVRREKRKNVHAFVRGDLDCLGVLDEPTVGVGYNPYQWDSFMSFEPARSGKGMIIKPITEARRVSLYVSGPENRSNIRALV
ncbi:hypothetical protein [Mesorhizobium sp.]|uniref:hypothetical protein n=1 Tax=Mesorhizobium sp. TaxID=1871066 RepID=UPI000FE61697|nr:hypothetical protein [Mesorhizobium sp.]RWM84294.1 MAG: hypothetical protein EOR83_16865 [Mesorhizobium sp.]